ncbi:hypothetical protein JL720_15393 [Aureococcus anophagefferens]|nr:hypothetical protein JL720_15393 [Aureococcus anophagefferens]
MPRRSRAPSPPPELDRERELLRLFSLLCCLEDECLNAARAETPKSCLASTSSSARKGGTTSLYQWLSAHPRAVGYGLDLGAEAGELQFFNHDGFFAGETPLLDRDSYLPTPKRRLDAAEDAAREERDDRAANATNATHAPKKKKGKKKPAPAKNATAARKACAPRCGAAQECFRGACHAPRAVYAAKFPCVRAGDVAGELRRVFGPHRAGKGCEISNFKGS